MRAAIVYANHYMNRRHVDLPNAATRRQLLHKYLDHMLVCACGVGLTVAVLFLASLA